MNSDEIGMVVAQATHMRIDYLERLEVDLLEPSVAFEQDPYLLVTLSKTIGDFQKNGQMNDAAAMMIWLHTLRSMATFEVRPHGRELWRQLARGFPHVAENATFLRKDLGVWINYEGYDEIPRGLEPEPT
jgi:hypothetical protein